MRARRHSSEIAQVVQNHLIQRIEQTKAIEEPFGHMYLENVFPQDLYAELLRSFPSQEIYQHAAERHYGKGGYVRAFYCLSQEGLTRLSGPGADLWRGVAAALTSPELKQAVYDRLSNDLAFRFGVPRTQVRELPGFARPTLYRETQGFEIPPHPDTRKKVVTMQLYLPEGRDQLDLGTALYRRRLLGWPFGAWQGRFEKVKQFVFAPNSGYAFVVNNKITRKSWHGREKLPDGAGVRNTLLTTFYETPMEQYSNYLAAA